MITTLLSLFSLKTRSIVPHPEVRKIYGKSVLMKIRKSSYIYTLTVGTVYWKNFGRISWECQNSKCTYYSIQQLWFEPYVSMLLSAAKSLQSCLTLCDPRDGSPPGSPVPGILQARTLEWVAISFSNAWKWKVKVKSLSRVRLSATPWTVAHQAPPSMEFSRQVYWSGVPLPSPSLL